MLVLSCTCLCTLQLSLLNKDCVLLLLNKPIGIQFCQEMKAKKHLVWNPQFSLQKVNIVNTVVSPNTVSTFRKFQMEEL